MSLQEGRSGHVELLEVDLERERVTEVKVEVMAVDKSHDVDEHESTDEWERCEKVHFEVEILPCPCCILLIHQTMSVDVRAYLEGESKSISLLLTVHLGAKIEIIMAIADTFLHLEIWKRPVWAC